MDVYTKKGCDVKVGAKKYLNGDYSKNGSEIELYTIDEGCDPEFYIRISSKDGSEITDDIIKSHVQIFYDVIETK
jgi:glutaredoxin